MNDETMALELAAQISSFKYKMEEIAKRLKKPARAVTYREYKSFRDIDGLSSYNVERHLGFQGFKDCAFPPEKHPFESILDLGSHERSRYIADLLLQCAEVRGAAPHEVTFDEFRRYINLRFGENDKGIARYIITKCGGFNVIRDGYFPPRPTEITKDKHRLQQHANMNRKLNTVATEHQFVLERLEEYAELVFKGALPPAPCKYKAKTTKRFLNLVLSDLHFGSDISAKETGVLNYGIREEARRLAHIVQQTARHKLDHREHTELNVLLIGDIFQNSLHDPRDGAVLAEQIARSIHLLGQAIRYLAINFKKVNVYCTTGNHGRFKSRHPGRAIHGKFDSGETVVYYALKSACANLTNVKFFIPETPYVSFEIFGKRVFATHGDTVLNPGNPGKNIEIGRLENQINKINASLHDRNEYTAFVCGHIHIFSHVNLPNGATVLTNAALVPPDPFAVSMGAFEAQCGQILWESAEDYDKVVGDVRFITVGEKQDRDKSLVEIIRPWEGFNG